MLVLDPRGSPSLALGQSPPTVQASLALLRFAQSVKAILVRLAAWSRNGPLSSCASSLALPIGVKTDRDKNKRDDCRAHGEWGHQIKADSLQHRVVPSSSDEHDDDADERAQARAEQPELRATPEMSLAFHARVKWQLTTQAQRRRPRGAPIATATARRRSLQAH